MSVSRLSKQSIQTGFPKQQTIWDQSTQPGAMDAISSTTITTAQRSVVFNNIPQTYTHLQLRCYVQSSRTSGYDSQYYAQFGNSGVIDVASNYSDHTIFGQSKTSSGVYGASGNGGGTSIMPVNCAGVQVVGNFGVAIWDILNYTNTNMYKTVKVLYGEDPGGLSGGYGGTVGLHSGNWRSTSAIDTISLTMSTYNFNPNSTIALYGIK